MLEAQLEAARGGRFKSSDKEKKEMRKKVKDLNKKKTPHHFARYSATEISERVGRHHKEKMNSFISMNSKANENVTINMLEANLNPGDLLYLPASWFHEVHSGDTHLALNAWFHPPGKKKLLDHETGSVYADDFWKKWYQSVQLPQTLARMKQNFVAKDAAGVDVMDVEDQQFLEAQESAQNDPPPTTSSHLLLQRPQVEAPSAGEDEERQLCKKIRKSQNQQSERRKNRMIRRAMKIARGKERWMVQKDPKYEYMRFVEDCRSIASSMGKRLKEKDGRSR
ncbi:unnamed protein product [Amoebophrya sp. A25]|nr:unnamed protein product [Amoebophrya sp. A25]|eukprot:GSA25T00008569001.1